MTLNIALTILAFIAGFCIGWFIILPLMKRKHHD